MVLGLTEMLSLSVAMEMRSDHLVMLKPVG